MRLNAAERLLINNPVRRWVQRHYEIPKLRRMAHRLDGMRALEIGCGPGFGMELILEHFGAATVSGIDIDPGMVQSRAVSYFAIWRSRECFMGRRVADTGSR